MSLQVEIVEGEERRRFQASGTLSVGRSEESSVVLPGLFVARRHIEIAQQDGGLRLRCKSPLGVRRNGKLQREDCDLRSGDRIDIAGHLLQITVDPESKQPLLRITVGDGGRSGPRPVLDLKAAGARMRKPAWIAALAVLVLLLAIPLGLRLFDAPPVVEAVLPTDNIWSSGRISNAHQHFASDCAACHEVLFQRVKDSACLECHAGIGHHSDDVAGVGLGMLDEQRCASCHREHGGTHAVLPVHPGTCVDCHAAPERFDAGDMRAVDGFKGHPAFRATVTQRVDGEPQQVRLPLADAPRDETGLIFPHDLHLDEEGVLGPDGPEMLDCASCHEPDAGKVGFREIRYERHCQNCHGLDVLVGDTLLKLPHAEPELVREQVLNTAQNIPAGGADSIEGPDGRRRAGPTAARSGPPSPEELVQEVFATRVCAKCHLVDEGAEDQAEIQPVVLRSSWLVHARFTHADHGWVACADCHAAESSAESEDLLLPDIASCRTCHAGVGSKQGIASTCIDCHAFHSAHDTVMGLTRGSASYGDAPLQAD